MSTNGHVWSGSCLHFAQRQEHLEGPRCHDDGQQGNINAHRYRIVVRRRREEGQQRFFEGLLCCFVLPQSHIEGPQRAIDGPQHRVDIAQVDLVLHQDKTEQRISCVEVLTERSDVRQYAIEPALCPVVA